MAKFYVQSGTLRAVVDSASADRAALWAIHQAMQQIAPLETTSDDNKASANNSRTQVFGNQGLDAQGFDAQGFDAQGFVSKSFVAQDFISLGDSIYLSEVGFDQEDSLRVDTFAAFREWHELWHALEKLEALLRV